ncbi:lytic murein transglycosylase [Novosphingobium sp. PhB57]|jgi:lytic murein transglycosylase|uniref:lytic murein transglycosylase n=1 Tax=Novosphingobium sp. PhB57 TaxID=2485107 RepID=UPI001047E239|nr:lytic murein transglycosylase [Novosphingobium sp. PhB57]
MTVSLKLRPLRHPLLVVALAMLPTASVDAQPVVQDIGQSAYQSAAPQTVAGQTFQAYLQTVGARARREGVSDATISRVLTGLVPNQRVIELDSAQPSRSTTPPPVAPYIAQHVGSSIIARGRSRYAELSGILPSIERRYGVPAPVLFAIWGHETNYGSYVGDFDLARSLATLAWEGRRRGLFEGELVALLKMVDQGVPPYRLKGSWAGAFGYPQFLPSVYLRLAVDGDGNGTRDIFTSPADTIASIANYFRDSGWRPGQPWGVPASLPSGFNANAYASKLAAPTCDRVHARHGQWKTVSEWRALGVTAQRPIGDSVLTSLFQPDGPGTPAYLLTGNYRVILQYNCSNYYALSVGLLADEIAR